MENNDCQGSSNLQEAKLLSLTNQKSLFTAPDVNYISPLQYTYRVFLDIIISWNKCTIVHIISYSVLNSQEPLYSMLSRVHELGSFWGSLLLNQLFRVGKLALLIHILFHPFIFYCFLLLKQAGIRLNSLKYLKVCKTMQLFIT